jgi:hypothetical protein
MIEEVKQLLYEIIATGDDDEEQSIKAVQQMGVSISNAVLKNGVNILQLQNITQKKVINKAVKALQILDAHAHEAAYPQLSMEHRVPLIVSEPNEEMLTPDEAFRNFIRAEVNDEVPAETFIYRVLQLYAKYVMNRYGDTIIAARKAGMPHKQFTRLLDGAN